MPPSVIGTSCLAEHGLGVTGVDEWDLTPGLTGLGEERFPWAVLQALAENEEANLSPHDIAHYRCEIVALGALLESHGVSQPSGRPIVIHGWEDLKDRLNHMRKSPPLPLQSMNASDAQCINLVLAALNPCSWDVKEGGVAPSKIPSSIRWLTGVDNTSRLLPFRRPRQEELTGMATERPELVGLLWWLAFNEALYGTTCSSFADFATNFLAAWASINPMSGLKMLAQQVKAGRAALKHNGFFLPAVLHFALSEQLTEAVLPTYGVELLPVALVDLSSGEAFFSYAMSADAPQPVAIVAGAWLAYNETTWGGLSQHPSNLPPTEAAKRAFVLAAARHKANAFWNKNLCQSCEEAEVNALYAFLVSANLCPDMLSGAAGITNETRLTAVLTWLGGHRSLLAEDIRKNLQIATEQAAAMSPHVWAQLFVELFAKVQRIGAQNDAPAACQVVDAVGDTQDLSPQAAELWAALALTFECQVESALLKQRLLRVHQTIAQR